MKCVCDHLHNEHQWEQQPLEPCLLCVCSCYRPESLARPRGGDLRFSWPFPRLRHWLRTGLWCRHPAWSDWRMIDTGMRQIRWCESCDKAQIR